MIAAAFKIITMFSFFRVERSQLIDVQVPQSFNGSTLNIPDQPMLRDKRVVGLEVYINTDMPFSLITSNPVANYSDMLNTGFIGYTKDPQNELDSGEYLYLIPLVALHNIVGFGNGGQTPVAYTNRQYRFDDLSLQWDKCQLKFADPSLVSQKPFSYILNVIYTSRRNRLQNLAAKVSGLSDLDWGHMVAAKMMQLEAMLQKLLGKRQE